MAKELTSTEESNKTHLPDSASSAQDNNDPSSEESRLSAEQDSAFLLALQGSTLCAGELLQAAKDGDIDRVIGLLTPGNIDISGADAMGYTLLHLASQHGCAKVAKALLAKGGIKVNHLASGGFTPLYIAAENGHDKFLISRALYN